VSKQRGQSWNLIVRWFSKHEARYGDNGGAAQMIGLFFLANRGLAGVYSFGRTTTREEIENVVFLL
jgi:hypothetical protein